MLDEGQTAPEFELQDQNGSTVSLSDYEGRRVVLYFYPKAKTGGCTDEAHGFRDRYDEFAERDVEVIGVSADPIDLISEFSEEEDLPFTLLSDEDGEVASAYESLSESGKAARNTYVIGPDGTVEAAYEGVSPEGHPDQVLEDIDDFERATA